MVMYKHTKGLSVLDSPFLMLKIRKENIMQVLDRLRMELSNQQYFPEEQYIQFLVENDLDPTKEYIKNDMQKRLLYTVLDVLEAVTNDIDLMTGISTEFSDIGQAYQFLEARIQQVKDKIMAIPEPEEDYSCFSLMFTNNNVPIRKMSDAITKDELDRLLGEEFE